MRTIRITHHDEGSYGWWFTSPDIPGLVGGPDNDADFEAACRWAEDAVSFHLECEAEERGESQAEDARIVHLVASPAAA
ncbi:MAG TPA: hypothetical protein VKB25_08785 [Conexibacter sp.]|nr:hypothetical protein [Conexibacter sp.]